MPSLLRANFNLSLHLSGPKASLLTINLPARFLGKDVWRSVPRFASIHFELRSRLWRYCFALRRSVTPFWGRNFVLVSFATPKWSINTLRGGRFFFLSANHLSLPLLTTGTQAMRVKEAKAFPEKSHVEIRHNTNLVSREILKWQRCSILSVVRVLSMQSTESWSVLFMCMRQ